MNNPFVYWAQDEKNIFLHVDVRDAVDILEKAEPKSFALKAIGTAANGQGSYGFELKFYDEIKADEKSVVVSSLGSGINVTLKKRAEGFWPSLTSNMGRIGWLKIDFNKWIDPDAEADEKREAEEESARERKIREFRDNSTSGSSDVDELTKMFLDKDGNPKDMDAFEALYKKALGPFAKPSSAYLILYNAALFLIHLFVLFRIGSGFASDGFGYTDKLWDENILWIRIATALQYMDVIHSLCGLTKSGYMAGIIQVSGRLAMTFIIGGCPNLLNAWTTALLVVDWFAIECFRYPYYITSIAEKDHELITWLRYSAWIPLYPTGLILEATSITRAIPFYYASDYGLAMPNVLNMSFNVGILLAVFLVGFFPFIAFYLLSHMKRQRSKKMIEMRKKKL